MVAKYLGAAMAVGFAAFGAAFGEGFIAQNAAVAIARQPKASNEIVRTMLITQAVAETGGIFGLLVSIILLFVARSEGGMVFATSLAAGGFCMGVGAIGSGLGSGQAGGAACESVGRQPRLSGIVLIATLVGQAITQTGAIFAMVVSLLVSLTYQPGGRIDHIGAVIGAGIAMGLGALGPDNGTGFVARNAIKWMSRDSKIGPLLLRTMILGQAVSVSTGIYSLIIAILLIIVPF